MIKRAVVAAFVAALTCLQSAGPLGVRPAFARAAAAQNDADDVKIRALLQRVEQIVRRADTAAFLDLLAQLGDRCTDTVPALQKATELERQPQAGLKEFS